MYDIIYDLTYDIIGQSSILSTAALRRRCGSGSLRCFLVSAALVLLSLSRSALILSALAIDTIRGAALAVAPYPDVHLVEPAAVPRSSCVSVEASPIRQSSLKQYGIVG